MVDNCNIGMEGGKALGLALKKNKALETLDISYNNIGSEGGKCFGEALKENHSLTSLNLSTSPANHAK